MIPVHYTKNKPTSDEGFVHRRNTPYDERLENFLNNPLPEMQSPQVCPEISETLDLVSIDGVYELLTEPIERKRFNMQTFLSRIFKRNKFSYKSQTEQEKKELEYELKIRAQMCNQTAIQYGKATTQLEELYLGIQRFVHELEQGLVFVDSIRGEKEGRKSELEGIIETLSSDLEQEEQLKTIFKRGYGEKEANILIGSYKLELESARREIGEIENDLRLIDINIKTYKNLHERSKEQEQIWHDAMDGVAGIRAAFTTTALELNNLVLPAQTLANTANIQSFLEKRVEGLSSAMTDYRDISDFLGIRGAENSKKTLKKLRRQLIKRSTSTDIIKKVTGGDL
jgi:hypothetical protein